MNKQIIEYINDLNLQKTDLEDRISKLPEGVLYVIKNGGKNRNYRYLNKKKEYIKNKDIILAHELALKKYYEYQLLSINNELKYINSYKNLSNIHNIVSFSETYPDIYELIKENYSFNNKYVWPDEYISTAGYEDQLIIETSIGINVRSKSEAQIVEALSSKNIQFRYEYDFEYYNKILHPDFTIINPNDGSIILWEHFGLMDDFEYRNNAIRKIQIYNNAGYILGTSLIITTETKAKPFSYKKACDVIKEYFHL